jgi:hypothetical protein
MTDLCKTFFDEYGNYKSRHIPIRYSDPVPNADVDALKILWMMTPRLIFKCTTRHHFVKSIDVRLNSTTPVVVAHEYMAPSELSKLTLDELKARKKST